MLSVLGAITMVPICFTAKERCVNAEQEAQQDVGLKEMFSYLKHNKYLLIFYIAFMVIGALNVTSVWGLYITRICLGDESISSISGILGILPSIVLGAFIPMFCRKVDKFKLFYWAYAATAVLTLAKFFIPYDSAAGFLIMTALASIPMGMTTTLTYMFTPDCAEYGHYKTGISAPGITFSVQTFFAKLQSAIVTAVSSLMLAMIGFVEGENAVQASGFAGRLWNASIIAPVAGIVLGLIILRAYKLNDHDVELMAKCNAGEISRAEAEAQMINKY